MKTRLKRIIWPLIYLVLIINVCISFILVFRSYYFRSIFVSGSSMEPTLHGVGDHDYGIIDDHANAIKNLHRFQIITTYYPFADSKDYVGGYKRGEKNVIDESEASYKIKRVYGFPGETIKFVVDDEWKAEAQSHTTDKYSEAAQYAAQQAVRFYVKKSNGDEFEKQNIKFKRKINIDTLDSYNNYEYTLGEEEYWVMGDNYSASSDCFKKKAPIYLDNIVGVLIAIEGTCQIESSVNVDSTEEGTRVTYKCTNRKRHLPVYY